jgi:hypothetical protein
MGDGVESPFALKADEGAVSPALVGDIALPLEPGVDADVDGARQWRAGGSEWLRWTH